MKFIAHRTCTVVVAPQSEVPPRTASVPLAKFAQLNAYVLIGEPGSGKSTALETEQQARGGIVVTVQDFLTFDEAEWRGRTLYLDGLDEVRAGEVDGRAPLERLLKKLRQLGRPRFRLSCRWADWLGAYDRGRLDRVSSDTLTVLQLDPLSEEDVKRILAENHAIADPEGFIAQARERGIDSLLTNPQNLGLIAGAVSRGHWPESRLEAFESACRMLVRERNTSHSGVNSTAGEAESLLEEAGRLCAVQILAGLAGFTRPDHVPATRDYPPVPGGAIAGSVSRVLRTKLFTGTSEGRLSPAHRQIAEFLAARHVSGLIADGLPLQRVVALITGFDGELVSPFLNFAAWLGVHSRPSRKQLCRLDPSGLFYAGDQATFSTEERRDVLANLRREARWNPGCHYARRRSGLGPLVSSELQDVFSEILSSPDREYPNQPHVMMLLQALGDGEPLPDLVDTVVQIVRDRSWLPGVRCAALDILIAYRKRELVQEDVLLELLGDIEAGKLDDPDDGLLGLLLKDLYPGTIPVVRVLKHLRSPKLGTFSEQFLVFWARHVPAESTHSQRGDLLDAITADFGSFSSIMTGTSTVHSIMGQIPAELVKFRLRGSTNDIPLERLWDWLLVAAGPGLPVLDSIRGAISVELERNDARLKELITFGVERCALAEDPVTRMRSMKHALCGARPANFGRWCADRALSASTELAAAIYIYLFVEPLARDPFDSDLTDEQFQKRLIPKPSLVARLDKLFTAFGHPPGDQGFAFLSDLIRDTEEQTMFQAGIEAESARLQQGYGSPHLLDRAAQAYFGISADSPGEWPGDRLGRLVGSRADLTAHLRAGLLGVPSRDDLPASSDVVAGAVRGAMPPLTLPFMAALHERNWSGRLVASEMGDSVVGLAVTILHSVPADRLMADRHHPFSTFPPSWLSQLLQDRPRSVADALTQAIGQKLAAGALPASELRALAEQHYREVAKFVCQPLLRTFPAESGTVFLEALGWLLVAALESCDGRQLEETIRHRLRNEELPEAQRIHWAAAGFFLDPIQYSGELRAFKNEPDCLGALLDFQYRLGNPHEVARRFEASELRLLIDLTRDAMTDMELTAARREVMSGLIRGLSPSGSLESAEILQELKDDPAFVPWALDISVAIEDHSARRRMREFRPCGIGEITNTLQNRRPANAGDLAALVVDEVGLYSRQFRDGSASSWKQFWNVDEHNRATDPRPEHSCRNAILSALQHRLGRLQIDAQPEGTHADGKRSDIRLSFGGFSVPVEIKRSCHRDLWTAMRSQLLRDYTRDPGAAGFGIYLVFWFGHHCRCKPTALKGWVPTNAGELEAKLREQLSGPERSRISVCVIDVSKPVP